MLYIATAEGYEVSSDKFNTESVLLTFPASKVCGNDCRMWHMSHKYKNIYIYIYIYTEQMKFLQNKPQEDTMDSYRYPMYTIL
jgi:hypothetical protein